MSRTPDFHPDLLLRGIVRRAAASAAAPDASADLDSARRGSVNAPIGDLSAADLQLLEARRELQAMRDRMKHLEQALRAAGRVLQPYLSNGR